MNKRTERAERTQVENGTGAELVHLVKPILMGMTTTRRDLLAWVHAHGLAAPEELLREEAVALAGSKSWHQTPRAYHHWGTTATEPTCGGTLREMAGRPKNCTTKGAFYPGIAPAGLGSFAAMDLSITYTVNRTLSRSLSRRWSRTAKPCFAKSAISSRS